MSRVNPPVGLEPLDDLDLSGVPRRPQNIQTAIRLNVRGRSVSLRGLRRPPTGILRWLLILGPGLITASAGNDAGGHCAVPAEGISQGVDPLSYPEMIGGPH